ncbi:hypothetical protein LPJ53_004039 [Coemansia erecta]|uniref:Uncharacterized protein n=1 Tax=Coemansia erecta TaxID=147472 RepID=A0A9W7XV51_9FUNG|nr:hypothetical protein LPJ53_004039 [Coemansia erecta]
MRIYWNNKDPDHISMFAKSLRPVLRLKIIYYMRLLLISAGMIWAPMCIFLGATYRRSSYLYRIELNVMDLDGGPVGSAISDYTISHTEVADTSPVWH